MAEVYERDEFDELAEQRNTEGAHRVRKRSYRWLIALLAVIVLAPLAGFGIGLMVASVRTGLQDSGTEAAASADTQADGSGAANGAEPEADSAEQDLGGQPGSGDAGAAAPNTPTGEVGAADGGSESAGDEAEDPTATLNHEADVRVLNGAGVAGLAGRKADQLRQQGFTSVAADDYYADSPEISTVYYSGEAMEATAQAIADSLGVGVITDDISVLADENSIEVVLRSDAAQ